VSSYRQSSERARELWETLQRLTPLPSERQSGGELRHLAARGQATNAIMLAFARDLAAPLDTPEFSAHLEQYNKEGTRELMRNGYRLRLAERDVMNKRMLVPLGQIEDVLRSSKSPREKTVAIAECLDTHETLDSVTPLGYMFSRHSMTLAVHWTIFRRWQSRPTACIWTM
jgi:hypothetical protein